MREAIQEYVHGRSENFPVSVTDMRHRIRFAIPDIDVSDEVLNELIAQVVIEAGGNVAFDARAQARSSDLKWVALAAGDDRDQEGAEERC